MYFGVREGVQAVPLPFFGEDFKYGWTTPKNIAAGPPPPPFKIPVSSPASSDVLLFSSSSLCGELTGLGPDNCLISRSDTVGCDFLNSAVIAGPKLVCQLVMHDVLLFIGLRGYAEPPSILILNLFIPPFNLTRILLP